MSKTQGIVLSGIKFKESSKILNVYTREFGKVSIMAQGVLKPKTKNLSSTEVFSLSDFELKKGRSFYYIESADLIDSNYLIRQDMDKMVLGFYAMELIDKSIPDEEQNYIIFDLLAKTLKTFCISDNPMLISLAFELKLASFLGYRPVLNSCASCSSSSAPYWEFHPDKGGIICDSCSKKTGSQISGSEINLMNKILLSKFEEIQEINSEKDTIYRLHNLISDHLLYNLDRKEFKSLVLLEQLKHLNGHNS